MQKCEVGSNRLCHLLRAAPHRPFPRAPTQLLLSNKPVPLRNPEISHTQTHLRMSLLAYASCRGMRFLSTKAAPAVSPLHVLPATFSSIPTPRSGCEGSRPVGADVITWYIEQQLETRMFATPTHKSIASTLLTMGDYLEKGVFAT